LPSSPLATPAPSEVELPAASRSDSLLSRYWELDADDKRGKLNYTAYRPNFFLPLREMKLVDRRPSSPTRGVATNLPDFQHFEAEFQVSMRSKVLQDFGLPGADLWAAYTQQSMWQLWNSSQSAPFRDTDYQPELIYVVPTPKPLQSLPLGWKWRMAQLGLVHQSNGQADPLSRSWNRAYAGFGLEHGSVIATLRVERRLDTSGGPDNDNPDITHYLGRGEGQLSWAPGRSIATLRWRPSFVGLGSVQLDWSYPIVDSAPDGARWFVRIFEGYGETLLDYNFRQTSIGAGVAIFKF
jgi:phospholipase A1